MQKKEKLFIGLNLIVSVIVLVLGVLCFAKLNFSESNNNEKPAITTELTTDTTSTETTTLTTATTETGTVSTSSGNSVITSLEAESNTTATTATTFVGPTAPVSVETLLETTTFETTAETTSLTEVVSSVLQEETTTTAIKKNVATMIKKTEPTPVSPTTSKGKTLIKTFTRGTYYAYGGPRKGGSGRQLINCATGGQGVKGSIASWYLYKKLGYNYKGKRTKVYLEIQGYPKMNGWYYLDDSCAPGYNNVCDFFYINGKSCPFSRQGVVQVKCYI